MTVVDDAIAGARPPRRRKVGATNEVDQAMVPPLGVKSPWSIRAESIAESVTSAAADRPLIATVLAVLVLEVAVLVIRL